MSKDARKWLERGKSLLIVALSCSALVLLLNTGQDSARSAGWLNRLQSLLPVGGGGQSGAVLLTETVRPVRMAVTTELGRYGVQYDNEKLDELFEAVNPLLTESMAACGPAQKSGDPGWRNALESPGIYFDFLGEVPLSALSDQEAGGLEQPSARRVVLTVGQGVARLWYWNEADSAPYFCNLTGTLREQLEEFLAQYATEGGGSLFAYEREEYNALSDWQLITAQEFAPQVYQAANPLGGELLNRVVQAAGFNPHSLYTVNGDLVVKDVGATLRIRPDGRVTYTEAAGAAARLSVAAAGETATPAEAVEGTRELLEQTLGQVQSEARYYLLSCVSEGDRLEVRFGCALDGAEVRLGGSGMFASFTVTGRQVSAFTLHFRSYTAMETTSLVLPLQQAIANMLAVKPEGGELLLCYPDTGADGPISASWSVTTLS